MRWKVNVYSKHEGTAAPWVGSIVPLIESAGKCLRPTGYRRLDRISERMVWRVRSARARKWNALASTDPVRFESLK